LFKIIILSSSIIFFIFNPFKSYILFALWFLRYFLNFRFLIFSENDHSLFFRIICRNLHLSWELFAAFLLSWLDLLFISLRISILKILLFFFSSFQSFNLSLFFNLQSKKQTKFQHSSSIKWFSYLLSESITIIFFWYWRCNNRSTTLYIAACLHYTLFFFRLILLLKFPLFFFIEKNALSNLLFSKFADIIFIEISVLLLILLNQ